MKNTVKYISFSFLFFLTPLFSFAQVIITEIMYDLEGSDTGREWIEVTNVSGSDIDISEWKFYENETNHGLTLYQGEANLSQGSSAIIVVDPSKFLADWGSFSGAIYDSSFSLSNTGESLSLRNSELIDIDSVNYISDWGAKGDGNSLQLTDGVWVAGTPSPGVYSSVTIPDENTEEGQDGLQEEQGSSQDGGAFGPTTNFPVGEISTKIIASKVILSGASAFFEAKSLGVKGEKLENARHLWNFGDGSVLEGEKVLYNYVYPGEYLIFLDVNSESFTASDKAYIKVIPSPLSISYAGNDYIRISNSSKEEVNISFWILQTGNKYFHIPPNTLIRSNGEINFPKEVTGLNENLSFVKLLYPNGDTSYEYEMIPKNNLIQDNISTSTKVTETSVTLSVPPNNQNQEDEVEKKDVDVQIASAVLAQNNFSETESPEEISLDESPNFFNKWFAGVIGIILISGLSIFFLRKDNKVEGFTIIE
jgi:hypothetical protein